MSDQLAQMRPEMERSQNQMVAQLAPSEKELEQMRQRDREDDEACSRRTSAKCRASWRNRPSRRSRTWSSYSRRYSSRSPARKTLTEMRRKIERSVPSQKELDEMKRQIQASLPSQKELDEMRRQIESSHRRRSCSSRWNELKKQMEQRKFDLQQMLKDFDDRTSSRAAQEVGTADPSSA